MACATVPSTAPRGEVSESAEGARLLSEYTGINLYQGFKSLPLRHFDCNPLVFQRVFSFLNALFRPCTACGYVWCPYGVRFLLFFPPENPRYRFSP